MLAIKLLLRNWRSGELKLLSLSLILAVAVLSGIAIFTDRLETTLIAQSNSVLGADNVVRSSVPLNPEYAAAAQSAGLKQTQAVLFSSMVYAGDEMHLASVKAVADGYPLRGAIEISAQPFPTNPADIMIAGRIPAPGEAWVDSRLLPLLKINIGDAVTVGEYKLRITKILVREPDSASPFSLIGARVLMNMADLPLTQVVQPGSRVDYQWLLAADNLSTLTGFITWLKPRLNEHQQLIDVESAQERLGKTLKTGKQFLLLAAVIAVLLAGVAIAIGARQFAERHTNQVALMKSLGVSALRIRQLYFGQLVLLGALASLIGLVIGNIIQQLITVNLEQIYHLVLARPGFYPYLLSFVSGLICLVFFALPALWFLPTVPPLKILRHELVVKLPHLWLQAALALVAMMLLVGLFSRDLYLAASLSGALLTLGVVSLTTAFVLLRASRFLALNAGGVWRLAFASLQRRNGQSLVQILVFSVAIMLLLTLTILRTSLIEEWRVQVPSDAPNHFLMNIAVDEVQPLKDLLSSQAVTVETIYPMVRGRLTHINGMEPDAALRAEAEALRRELNLTWSASLAADNKIVEGQWWDNWQQNAEQIPGVSVEINTAKTMGLDIGDRLRFSIGGLEFDAQVASLRSLEWRSMRPNFFFIFEPSSLTSFSPVFTTSIFLPSNKKTVINDLLRSHPSILVIELDRIIEQIRSIIDQVSNGIQLVLGLTLIGGCLVLFAAVMSSIDSRKQEAGLLRALGSSSKLLLTGVFIEFAILGLLAGVIAILGAEVLLISLQVHVLNTPIQPHYQYWLASPLISALFVATLGVACCRQVVTTPPVQVLRDAA